MDSVHTIGTYMLYVDRSISEFQERLPSIVAVKGGHVCSSVQHEHHSLQ